MKKVIICLLSSRRNKERQDWIRASWGKNCELVFYSDHSDLSRRVYQVSDQTHYRSNEEKHINFLNQVGIKLSEEYKWLFFADDDSFVNVANLHEWIDSLSDQERIYANLITYKNAPDNPVYQLIDKSLIYPAGGAGYLISSKVVKEVFPFINYGTGFSDVSFGKNMARCQISQMDYSDRLFSQSPEFYGHEIEEMKRAVSYHYIKTKDAIQNLATNVGLGPVNFKGRSVLRDLFSRHWPSASR